MWLVFVSVDNVCPDKCVALGDDLITGFKGWFQIYVVKAEKKRQDVLQDLSHNWSTTRISSLKWWIPKIRHWLENVVYKNLFIQILQHFHNIETRKTPYKDSSVYNDATCTIRFTLKHIFR